MNEFNQMFPDAKESINTQIKDLFGSVFTQYRMDGLRIMAKELRWVLTDFDEDIQKLSKTIQMEEKDREKEAELISAD